MAALDCEAADVIVIFADGKLVLEAICVIVATEEGVLVVKSDCVTVPADEIDNVNETLLVTLVDDV